MSTSPPRRRFLPEPVETSGRSSKHPMSASTTAQPSSSTPSSTQESPSATSAVEQMKAASASRRFLPQPVETSSKSSTSSRKFDLTPVETTSRSRHNRTETEEEEAEVQKAGSEQSSPTIEKPLSSAPRRFAPQPVETTSRSSHGKRDKESTESVSTSGRRRFLPEPEETSARSHRGKKDAENESAPKSERRRFLPEPVENTSRSSRAKRDKDAEPVRTSGRRKFLPEPVETTSRHRTKRSSNDEKDDSDSSLDSLSELRSTISRAIGPRKFVPELVETARGSFRRADSSTPPDPSPGDHPSAIPRYMQPPLVPANTPLHSSDQVPQIDESRFSAASLAKRHHMERQHSFIVPDLPIIQSDSSENSDIPSLSTSPSASSDESELQPRVSRGRRGGNENVSGYELSMTAQAAEKQLRDQVMAAYPNEKVHEPVDHFRDYDDDDDEMPPLPVGKLSINEGKDVRTFRRESAADLDWQLREMRRHHEEKERKKKEQAKGDLRELLHGESKFSSAALASKSKRGATKKVIGGHQKGVGLVEMRNAASPPMLGDDIVFPLSLSPKMTRCDTDQIPVPRTADKDEDRDDGGALPNLWSANVNVLGAPESGLWMGLCQKSDASPRSPPTPMRSGIMTPLDEPDDPVGLYESPTPSKSPNLGRGLHKRGLPLTPSASSTPNDPFTDSIDQKLTLEQDIDQEFPNAVITQIYNYLSLGYPSLAHKFDEELSKISKVPLEALRKDDEQADAKGHVGAPEGKGADEDEVTEGRCMRWTALRVYVREWRRQRPEMHDKGPSDWGARARRGSWAI